MSKKTKIGVFFIAILAVFLTVGACNVSAQVVPFINPLQFDNVEGLLASVLTAVQRIVVVLALVFIVIGALLMLTSAGTEEMVTRGKKAITMAIVGLAIGIAAPSFLKEIAIILKWIPECNEGDPSCANVEKALTLSQIAMNVLNFLLGISGVLALIMLVIGGIMYLTSAGDEDRIASGKKIFTYSVIGVVVIFSSMVLVKQIAKLITGA